MVLMGYIASVLMGVSLGLIGGGGSILTVPILFYFFGQDSLLATTNSLFVVGFTAFLGAVISAYRGNIDIKTGITFALPSFAGVYFARKWLLPSLPNDLITLGSVTLTKPLLVMLAFSGLMVLASKAMIQAKTLAPKEKEPSRFNVASKGFMVGVTTGFVGAGGGFLIIPALVLLLGLSMRVAVGTSLAIIAANSIFGFFVSESGEGARDWMLLLTICGLGALGMALGQWGAGRIPDKSLKRGFGIFVLIVGTAILVDQVRRLF